MADVGSPFFQGLFPETQGFMPGPGAYEPNHTGIDIGLPSGTPLLAPSAGTVEDLLNPGGFGTYQVFHPAGQPGVEFVLGHESAWSVPSGPVDAGAILGYSGSSGWSTGPHLHLQENVGAPAAGFGGTPVDPSGILTSDANSQATLLTYRSQPGQRFSPPPGSNDWQQGQHDTGSAFPPIPGWLSAGIPPLAIAQGAQAGIAGAQSAGKQLSDTGAGIAAAGGELAASIGSIPTNLGHGLADFLAVTETDLGIFFQRQIVVLAVAAVVLLVLFNR